MQIVIEFIRHGSAGLWAAVSDDLKGLFVVGPDIDDIQRRLPAVVEAMYERQGERVKVVRLGPLDETSDSWNPPKTVKAQLEHCLN